MLRRLVGSDPIEIGKTLLLVFVTLIAAIALQQLAATRTGQTVSRSERSSVLEVAGGFGRELTTYDYAHPDVQTRRLDPLVTRSVLDRVKSTFPDLALYQAVSVGGEPDAYLESLDSSTAQVLLRTHSTMQSQYTPPGTKSSGLLVCRVRRQGSEWLVSDFEWLTPSSEGVS